MSSRAEHPVIPSPLWRRLVAIAVDLVPAGGLGLIAVALIIASDPTPPEIPPWNTLDVLVDYVNLETTRFFLCVVTVCGLAALLQAWQLRRFGVTLGTHLLGLRLAGLGGSPDLTFARLFAWTVTGIVGSAFGAVTWWWGFVDPERRTLHDRLWRIGLDVS